MSKKKKSSSSFSKSYNPSYERAEYEVTRMKHKDLQRACVGRGMDFQQVVESGIPELHKWFVLNYDRAQSLILINEFDDWKELQLRNAGHDKDSPYFHPALRLGFIAGRDEDGNSLGTKKPRLKGLKKEEKPKKERVAGFKIFAGTKKAMTYQLTKDKLTLLEIIEKVMAQFPDANEKSISIWYKRCLKEIKK